MYPSYKEAKDLIIDIGRKMHEGRFVSANDGNITVRAATTKYGPRHPA